MRDLNAPFGHLLRLVLVGLAITVSLQPTYPRSASALARAPQHGAALQAPRTSEPRGTLVPTQVPAGLRAAVRHLARAANSTGWIQQAEPAAADIASGDDFGLSVALSADGNTALVSAYRKAVGGNTMQGAAYVFTSTGGSWSQQAELTAADGRAYDEFGNSVALSGDGSTAVVGTYAHDAVYVFTRMGSNWSQQAELTAADGAGGGGFGTAEALSGDGSIAMVGDPGETVGRNDPQGAAYVFTRTGSSWSQQAELTAADGAVDDGFGSSVALSGDGSTALVGADNKMFGEGAAYLFTRTSSSWSQQAELTDTDGVGDDLFGGSVALSGDGSTALVGASNQSVGSKSNQGAAYLFTRTSGDWSQQAELTEADGVAGNEFGSSVALSGDGSTALVGGGEMMVGSFLEYGAAYVFTRANSSSSQQATLVAADGAAGDGFGSSVALSGDGSTALVGASDQSIGGSRPPQGAAYVFAGPAGLLVHYEPPEGLWVSPANGQAVGDTVTLQASASPSAPGGPAIGYVDFSGFYGGSWHALCHATAPSSGNIYQCPWTLEGVVPPGDITISFDVYDQAGQSTSAPDGTRIVHYAPPEGKWIAPANGQVVSGTVTMQARAYPSTSQGAAISSVSFTASYGGSWHTLCKATAPVSGDTYQCSGTLRGVVPRGDATIGFDVYDQAGVSNVVPDGTRILHYAPPPPPMGTPPSCLGANDLLVAGQTVLLTGTQVLDHLCVVDGGHIESTGDLTLTVGVLYVDASSSVSADGTNGFRSETHDGFWADGSADGEAGHALVINAYQATIAGLLSANGGAGWGYNEDGEGDTSDPGQGRAGGTIRVSAGRLDMPGNASAIGGAGGDATASTYSFPEAGGSVSTGTWPPGGPSDQPSGNGGHGGSIALSAPAADLARVPGPFDVHGGIAGKPGVGGAGTAGTAGTVQLVPLSTTAAAALPPAPGPLLARATSAPAIHTVPASRMPHLPCGPGDLVVPAGTTRTLSGAQQFSHICIGGTLQGTGDLTLVAQTIDIMATGAISLDGRSPLPFVNSNSGRYTDTGTCAADHGAAHAGITGPAGGETGPIDSYSAATGEDTAAPAVTPEPGEGGGRLTLIAGSVAIQGRVQANGGAGQAAPGVESYTDGQQTWAGAGGGSGGGISIFTHRLMFTGSISATGGTGGNGSGPDSVDGLHGSGGCVKVFAGQVDSLQATLAISGSAFVDTLNPADPVPPPAQPGGAIYDAATHHSLADPFLSYWRTHGGLALLGHPLSEAFTEHGVLQQYTERALLQVVHGTVQPAALGTLLTAGLHFPRISHAPPGARYFPATGHSLGDPFLAYWLAHQGATLLGAPLSEVLQAGSSGDGPYKVQWFERGRLEYHPDFAAPNEIQLGQIGRDALHARGWLIVATSAAPSPGSIAGARLYALAANGDVFESDGSTAWHYLGGTIADPAQCWVYQVSATSDGNAIFVSSATDPAAGGGPDQLSCVPLWHSVNGALQPVASSQVPPDTESAEPGLVLAPDGHTVYLLVSGSGLYKSSDAGTTWSKSAVGDDNLGGFVMNQASPSHLWAQAQDGSSSASRIYLSDDAGASWRVVSTAGTPIAGHLLSSTMTVDTRFSDGLWVGTDQGLYHTVNGGQTWEHVGNGLPLDMSVSGVAVSPFDPNLILVWHQEAGIYYSADGGRTWHQSTGAYNCDEPWSITFDPVDHQHIYRASPCGVAYSRDGGRSWSFEAGVGSAAGIVVSRSHADLAYLMNGIAYRADDTVYRSTVYRTTDGGVTWQQWAGGDLSTSNTIVALAGVVP